MRRSQRGTIIRSSGSSGLPTVDLPGKEKCYPEVPTDGPGGRHFVERLRQVFGRHTFADLGPGKAPSISAGVVAYPHSEALRPEDLFTLVENALQRAKGAPERIAVAGST